MKMRTEIEIRFIFSFHGNLVYVVQQDYLGNRVKQTTTSTSLQQLHNIELVSEKNHTQIMSFFLYTLVWFFSIHINLPSYRSKVILFSFCYSFHHWHTRYTIINLLLISYLSSIYIHNTNFNPPYYPYLLLLLPWTKKRKKCDAYIRLTTPTRASKATIVY